MELFTVTALAVALGTDAFSLCLGLGLAGVKRRQIVIFSLTVFIFHVVMPLLGWYAGGLTGALLGRVASFLGAGILIYLGLKMIYTFWQNGDDAPSRVMPVHIAGLLGLAFGVSVDALGAGFSLGAGAVNLLLTVTIIGVTAGLMTAAGFAAGRAAGARLGRWAVLGGGLLLLGVGIRMTAGMF